MIEALVTRLVQDAPVIDAAIVAELVAELATFEGDRAPLAVAIARCVQLVAAGEIDAGISLPHLAMACASLAASGAADAGVLAAVQYEIETLLPMPARPRLAITEPDVPLVALSRGPRPRT